MRYRKDSTNPIPGRGHIKIPSLAFFICLAISLLLWMSMKLSREYTVTYNYDISCSGKAQGHTVDQLSSNTLTLVFKGRGFAFMNPHFREKNRHIDFDLAQLYKNKGAIETTQFTQNELSDYIKEYAGLGSDFVSVEDPNVLFVYIK